MVSQDRKKAGVAILISSSCLLQVLDSIIDPGGRYIILLALYQGLPMVLCNTYVANTSQITFLWSLLTKLFQMSPSGVVIGGDFNIAFSDSVNKLLLQGKKLNPDLGNLSRSFRQLIRKFSLVLEKGGVTPGTWR